MEFSRKKFSSSRVVILSEQSLYPSRLEERISHLIPALETRIDSFETYLSAYEHCSSTRNVGLILMHQTALDTLPINAIDELAAPFETVGSIAGLVILAENESLFAESYKRYGSSPRLLTILLEKEIETDSVLRTFIMEAWTQFERLQRENALPKEELDFLTRIAKRFEDIGTLSRVTKIMTASLDRGWYEDLIIESAPALLSIPNDQRWILENSASLLSASKELEPYREKTIESLLVSKENDFTLRAVVVAHKLCTYANVNRIDSRISELTAGVTSFAPTLKKILNREKLMITEIIQSQQKEKIA